MKAIAVLLLTSMMHTVSAAEMRVEWTELPTEELIAECYKDTSPRTRLRALLERKLLGCAKREGDVCQIFTRDQAGHRNEKSYLDTVGHELKHCRDGDWHPEEH